MAYCGAHGIPHSVFLGRIPKAWEPYWLAEDRAKALEWQAWEADRCPGCGLHTYEWFGPDGKELRDLPFEVAEVYCPACHVLEDARAEKSGDGEDARGRHHVFQRVWTAD